MSEQRPSTLMISIRASVNLKIEVFPARLWKSGSHRARRKFHPPWSFLHGYWDGKYRVRFNGKWLMLNGFKYTFYTIDEIFKMVADHGREVLS